LNPSSSSAIDRKAQGRNAGFRKFTSPAEGLLATKSPQGSNTIKENAEHLLIRGTLQREEIRKMLTTLKFHKSNQDLREHDKKDRQPGPDLRRLLHVDLKRS